MIKEHDKVRFTTGERGNILEDFGDGVFLAEIIAKNGEVRIDEVKKWEIKAKIIEVEEPIAV
ncbi:MAG: hypothetical protein FWB96_09895 [Defluviitaleaceae bacterium]|nr:hypothetical protein [Defluviitaleaceae bacterium]MCL2263169.1 hypothetical protein [Defluviitaleaceae bacterium]